MTELPDAYRDSIDLLQKLTALELRRIFLKSWMKHISLKGFKTIPHANLKLSVKSRIRLRNEGSLILWQRGLTSNKKFYFSFGGVLVEGSSGFLKLIKTINTGKTCFGRKRKISILCKLWPMQEPLILRNQFK